MDTYNRYTSGPCMDYHPSGAVSPSSGPDIHSVCEHSTTVAGDFKRPNYWYYNTSESFSPKGVSFRSIHYPDSTSTFKSEGCISLYPDTDILSYTRPTSVFNSCLNKVNNLVRGELDLAVALAESGQTARMLNILRRVREFKASLNWRSIVKGISNARAEYSYGWRPLANDLYNALDESQNVIINRIRSVKARSFERVDEPVFDFYVKHFGNVSSKVKRVGGHYCEIGLAFDTSGHDLDRWASLNPVSLAWELLPYSFVLDWIVDVGSYLRNFETGLLYGNSFRGGYVSALDRFTAHQLVVASRNDPSSGQDIDLYCNFSVSGKRASFVRTPLTSYPLPYPPSFKVDIGAGRLLNLAALIGQKIK